MLILNDLHIGFRRQSGTTPSSREALRNYLLASLQVTMETTGEDHLVILGDLFDDFEVDTRDFMAAFMRMSAWLNTGKRLTLVAGNHDHSARGSRVSHFMALCDILSNTYSQQVEVLAIGEHGWVCETEGAYAVAHCANQDLFEHALDEVPVGVKYLLLHANYHNNFAVESDHSLNVSEARAREFADRGTMLIFAHEHQARVALNGLVQVLGNQFPTSVSDCLGNSAKYSHILKGGVLDRVVSWSARDSYLDVDWQDLAGAEGQFIRVSGTATASQASDVVNTIAAFRQRSDAFVVSNAVRVEGIIDVQDLPEKFEAAKVFDVMEFILSHLDADEAEVVKGLLN